MRKYLLVATGVALFGGCGVALAQMPPPGAGASEGRPMGAMGGPGGGMEHHEDWMMRHRPHGDGAAFFRFRRGDAEMDIKCPVGENVQACVAAAGSLMDKVGTMGQPKAQ